VKFPGLELDFKKAFDSLATLEDIEGSATLLTSLYYQAFASLGMLAARAREFASAPPIVVFIDDLDRCLPEQALRVLQGIRLVLSQPGFIFVLALHREPLERHLAKRFGELDMREPERCARAFLDKSIQLGLPLPRHARRFDDYVNQLLDTKALKGNPDVATALRALAPLMGTFLDANPRRFVRLTNNLIVDHVLLQGSSENLPSDWLGLCAVARLLREELGDVLYEELVRDRETCEKLAEAEGGQVKEWESHEEGPPGSLKPREELHRTLGRLTWFPSAQELITSDLGRQWLKNYVAREQIDEFLVAERGEAEPVASSPGVAAIEVAVRRSLGFADGQAIDDKARARVRDLDLSYAPVTDSDLVYLEPLTSLTALNLSATQVSGAGPAHLDKLTALTALNLSGAQVTDAGLAHLLSHLGKLKLLTVLHLAGTQVTDACLARLAKLTTLTMLDLSETKVTDVGLEQLEALTSLTSLDLSETKVTDAGLEHLKELPLLTSLNLWGTQVADEGLAHIGKLGSLMTLNLSSTQVTGAGLVHLGNLEFLRALYLASTKVTDGALTHLVGLPALRELNVANTPVTDTGLTLLRRLAPLEVLSLHGTGVSDAGVIDVAGVPSLRILWLSATGVTDAGLAHVAKLEQLRLLSLNGTQVTDAGLAHLEKLTTLTELFLLGTKVTGAGLAKLKQALPDLKVER
jgi:Leucine-rich repeat (LRR) protein